MAAIYKYFILSYMSYHAHSLKAKKKDIFKIFYRNR